MGGPPAAVVPSPAFTAGENAKQPSTSRIVPSVMFSLFIFFLFVDCFGLLLSSHREKSLLAVHWCTARDLTGCYKESGGAALNH